MLLLSGLVDEIGHPLSGLGAPAGVLRRLVLEGDRTGLAQLMERAGTVGRGGLSLLRAGTLTPRSSLNGPVGSRRLYTHVEVPLGSARQVAQGCACTLNDVVLALVAGGFRALLLDRGDDLSRRFPGGGARLHPGGGRASGPRQPGGGVAGAPAPR